MKNKLKFLSAFALLAVGFANAQVGVGTTTPDASSVLDVYATDKGLLLPRLTTAQRNTIAAPAAGLAIYNTTTNCLNFYTGTSWNEACGSSVYSATSGGSAIVSAYPNCTTDIAGSLVVGTPVTGVTQTITATVTTAGTCNISATANGVTFAYSGNLVLGTQNIVLTATGTPTAVGDFTYALSTTPGCNFTRSASLAPVYPFPTGSAKVNGVTKTFMAYNLGVTGTQDPLTYQGGANNGELYQWGKNVPVRTATTQAGPVASAAAAGTRFITHNGGTYDWISTQDNSLWGASKTANDPCPTGFRVPTQAEWGGMFAGGTTSGAPGTATQNNTWTWTGAGYTVGTSLYLPAAGLRRVGDATLTNVGTAGFYWSSTVDGTYAYSLTFSSGNVLPGNNFSRGDGLSVRCIAE